MANEIFEKISKDIKEIDMSIVDAKDLISALREAGEDTVELESKFRELEKKKTKWQKVLESRGYK